MHVRVLGIGLLPELELELALVLVPVPVLVLAESRRLRGVFGGGYGEALCVSIRGLFGDGIRVSWHIES